MTDRKSADRIVSVLKTEGPSTTAELATALSISVPAVRQHLNNLAASGLLVKADVRGGVGRPPQRWSLTRDGHDRFPDAHAEMTVALIASVRATLGEEALQRVMADRYQTSLVRYRARIPATADLETRLQALAKLRDEEGYMPELVRENGDGWLFVENHCPICRAAEVCQGFCSNELELFRAMLGPHARVDRVEYLMTGDRRCAYRIR